MIPYFMFNDEPTLVKLFLQVAFIKMNWPTLVDLTWDVNAVRWVILYHRILPQEKPKQNAFCVHKVRVRRYKRLGNTRKTPYST